MDEQQRQEVGQQFLAFIDEVQQLSQTRLREIRDEVLQQGVEDPFAKSSVNMLKASNEMVSAAIGMRTSSENFSKNCKQVGANFISRHSGTCGNR